MALNENLELNSVRGNILFDAVHDNDINNLQLAEITRHVFSQMFFEKYFKLLYKTQDLEEVMATLKESAFSMATSNQHLN